MPKSENQKQKLLMAKDKDSLLFRQRWRIAGKKAADEATFNKYP